MFSKALYVEFVRLYDIHYYKSILGKRLEGLQPLPFNIIQSPFEIVHECSHKVYFYCLYKLSKQRNNSVGENIINNSM